jgi:hypothetical protein
MHIQFKIAPNDSFHKDFIIKIGENKIVSDTYHFWEDRFGNAKSQYDEIQKKIARYLSEWALEIKNLSKNEQQFIPIDFSDEYIGGFKVVCLENELLSVNYGFITDINDLVIQVKENGGVSTNLCNRRFEEDLHFEMNKNDFLNSLKVENTV